jgi:hypothetical protein
MAALALSLIAIVMFSSSYPAGAACAGACKKSLLTSLVKLAGHNLS